MSMLTEEAFVFTCEGVELPAVIHHSHAGSNWGLLCIVAGGPQYRGGCGRQLVELARQLASGGFPVMRFDHRGLGDGDGEFLGFEYVEEDLQRAIEEFLDRVPGLERVVLWGGCDAASAALINAMIHPAIGSIIAANPWVSTAATSGRVRKKHYMRRLGELSFWKKFLTLKYNPFDYLGSMLRRRRGKWKLNARINTSASSQRGNYVDRMRDGFDRFTGPVLILMSGRSLISREFDELVEMNGQWQAVCERATVVRKEITDADQTFSTKAARNEMIRSAREWMEGLE